MLCCRSFVGRCLLLDEPIAAHIFQLVHYLHQARCSTKYHPSSQDQDFCNSCYSTPRAMRQTVSTSCTWHPSNSSTSFPSPSSFDSPCTQRYFARVKLHLGTRPSQSSLLRSSRSNAHILQQRIMRTQYRSSRLASRHSRRSPTRILGRRRQLQHICLGIATCSGLHRIFATSLEHICLLFGSRCFHSSSIGI